MCETTGRLAQARRLRPKGVLYNTTHTRESQARRRKKLTERISVSHTLNLLRNGIILQKGHIIYTVNAKSQVFTTK